MPGLYEKGNFDLYDNLILAIERNLGTDYRYDIEMDIFNNYDEYDKLIDIAKKSINIKGSNSKAYQMLGDGYFHQKRFFLAAESYMKAEEFIDQSDESSEKLFYLKSSTAECLIYQNEFDKAEIILDKLTDEYKDKGILYIHKARIAALKDDSKGAVNNLVKGFAKSDNLAYVFSKYEELMPFKEDKMLKKYF